MKIFFFSLVNTNHKLRKYFTKKFLSTRATYPPPNMKKIFFADLDDLRVWKKIKKKSVTLTLIASAHLPRL